MNAHTNPNIRKAAILIRSLDGDAAAAVLSRLSPSEAKAVRLAIQSLGEIDADERADVSAEFRRSGSVAQEDPRHGVELDLSSSIAAISQSTFATPSAPRPFEFLENARVESLVPYLAREHAQTVAVVLSYLAPGRAAQVLSALPEKLQADAIERLSLLGDTDPSSLQVLERELADWVARQQATRVRPTGRIDMVAAILASANESTRREILGNLVKHNRDLAQQLAPPVPKPERKPQLPPPIMEPIAAPPQPSIINHQSTIPAPPPLPQLHIDDLARFDQPALTTVLKSVDADLLVLALVGASEALVGRITEQMPGKVAKAFRARLNHCGPTRLRDVEAAQQEVAHVAAQVLHDRLSTRHALNA
jgi:flagellar motor switch protein FliG